jgi:hypothetical protein
LATSEVTTLAEVFNEASVSGNVKYYYIQTDKDKSAQNSEKLITIAKAQELLENNAILLVFGTGWGLTDKVLKQVDFMLEPLHGIGNFNHLSVRSAVSIILDRLIGF